MSSLSLVVRRPRRKSMGTSHIRDRQLRRYYRLLLLFAKILQNRMLGLLKGRTSSYLLEVKYVNPVGVSSRRTDNKNCNAFQNIKSAPQDATVSTPAPVPALPHKLSVSFAAVANGTPDTSKEVSVSA
jgi:hypothetical protein